MEKNNYLLQQSSLQMWLDNALKIVMESNSYENFGYAFYAILNLILV